jgi:ABC-type molybdate transport system permease subunit
LPTLAVVHAALPVAEYVPARHCTSSLVMVPVAVVVPPTPVAPTMLVTFTENSSVGSTTRSPFTATVNVYELEPAEIVCALSACAT